MTGNTISKNESIDELTVRCDVLEGRIKHLEKELEFARNHDAAHTELVESLRFLSRASLGFLELNEDQPLYEYIAEKLLELAPDAYVVVTSFDAQRGEATVRSALGFGRLLTEMSKLLGHSLVGMTFPIPEKGVAELSRGTLQLARGGIYELTDGRIPRNASRLISRLLKIGPIYGMGFAWKKELIGTAIVGTRRGRIIRSAEVFEAFISQASIILQRRRIEREKGVLEAKLSHIQKLDALGSLAGGIAHDFNNLLMCMQGDTTEAILSLDPGEPAQKHLKSIQQLIVSGAELSGQLLGIAHEGKYEVKIADMRELITNTLSLFGRTHKKIAIDSQLDEELWFIEADVNQIQQSLLNIFINAAQAMPEGGTLSLEAVNEQVSAREARHLDLEAGNYLKLSITDTGTGIDAAILPRIFDPFFTTRTKGKSTGLGLASAFGVLRNHGGTIEVESTLGQGTTFTLYLPATQSVLSTYDSEVPESIEGKGKVLIVDDEILIVKSTRRFLERLGYETFSARSGTEALSVFDARGEDVDLVILDMIMPEMGGVETFHRLKERSPQLKVLISSGFSVDGEEEALVLQEANGFLRKPFTIEELSLKVSRALSDEEQPSCE